MYLFVYLRVGEWWPVRVTIPKQPNISVSELV